MCSPFLSFHPEGSVLWDGKGEEIDAVVVKRYICPYSDVDVWLVILLLQMNERDFFSLESFIFYRR